MDFSGIFKDDERRIGKFSAFAVIDCFMSGRSAVDGIGEKSGIFSGIGGT